MPFVALTSGGISTLFQKYSLFLFRRKILQTPGPQEVNSWRSLGAKGVAKHTYVELADVTNFPAAVYMYTYIYIYVCVHINIHPYILTFTHNDRYMCIHIYIYRERERDMNI